jgi:hypothetical protein
VILAGDPTQGGHMKKAVKAKKKATKKKAKKRS